MHKFLVGAVVVLSFGVVASAQAATITGSLSDWVAYVGATYSTTTDFGVADGTSVGAVELADGQTLGSVDGVTVYTLPSSEPCCTTTGSGQVLEEDYYNETFIFSTGLAALGFLVEPNATEATTITVALSDGTNAQINADFSSESSQFIGFYGASGGDIDSISIAFNNADDQSFDLGNVVDSAVSTPEPMSMAVLLTGVTGLGMARRRRPV